MPTRSDRTTDAGVVCHGADSAQIRSRPCHQRIFVLETCRLQDRPMHQLPAPAEAAIDCPRQQSPRRIDVVYAKLFVPRRFSIAVKGRMQAHLRVARSANNRIADLGRVASWPRMQLARHDLNPPPLLSSRGEVWTI